MTTNEQQMKHKRKPNENQWTNKRNKQYTIDGNKGNTNGKKQMKTNWSQWQPMKHQRTHLKQKPTKQPTKDKRNNKWKTNEHTNETPTQNKWQPDENTMECQINNNENATTNEQRI